MESNKRSHSTIDLDDDYDASSRYDAHDYNKSKSVNIHERNNVLDRQRKHVDDRKSDNDSSSSDG